MLKQHFEMVGKLHKIKEIQTKTGKWMYSFSVPITKMVGDEQHTQWLQATVILKDKDPRLTKHNGEFHFTGSLVVKEAWKDYPESLSFLGFEIEPVLGNVYRISKPKSTSEDAAQAPTVNPNVPTQAQSSHSGNYEQDFPVQSETVPF